MPEDSGAERASQPDPPDPLDVSLDYLHELLLQWRQVWVNVIEEMQKLPAAEQERLRTLPVDPQEGLLALGEQFANAFHPDIPRFLVSNLDAAARTIEQLRSEHDRGGDPDVTPEQLVEQRLERLEAILGGVGAVLRTLDIRSHDEEA